MSSSGQVKLKEFAELVNQPYQPSSDENINYIGLEHIEQQTLRLNGIGNSSDVISQKHKFRAGDILFGKLRPYFRKVVRPSFDGVCSTDIWVVRAKPGFDQSFLFYFLANKSFIDECNSSSSGTRMPRADWNHLSETLWELPTLPEQKRIAEILSALDDKIELNRQTNVTLEAIAQAIFKEWFVDFNYPGATGELVDTPLGPIPKGWRVGILGDLVNISSGKGLSKKQFQEEGYPILGANGRIGFTDNYLCNEEVILTGRVGTLGTFQLVHTEVWISDNVLIMKPSKRENYYFTYFWIKTVDFQSLNRGSTQPLVTKTDLLNLQVLIPSSEELSSFDCISRSLFNTLSNNNQQTATLSEIRDAILPKLMSGEIEV